MGKPRLIVLVRHAQSEGNKNRSIHQVVPDHRVKLTDEGWKQAEDAGHRLRHLLNEDDTLQIFTSPYQRTRQTTEGILRTLTSSDNDDESKSAPCFSRSKIKVYEEPRLREQDFGNFQPCSAEMERMWQERADYGHFFYRIPNGESAADAYDRISGFNESLWRQFSEPDFPSVCVMVTHGLMTRVFLMKWYHWSVEYFEDLRNVNHCEFVVMKLKQEGKYSLENQLRTWTELKRQRAEREHREVREMGMLDKNPSRRNTLSAFLNTPTEQQPVQQREEESRRQWGGCVDGCQHGQPKQQEGEATQVPPPVDSSSRPDQNEGEDHALAHQEPSTHDGTSDSPTSRPKALPSHMRTGSNILPSGADTPHEMPSDDELEHEHNHSYFPSQPAPKPSSLGEALRNRPPERKPTPEDIERWTQESGMGAGKQADALGDEPVADQDGAEAFGEAMLERLEREDKGVRGSVY